MNLVEVVLVIAMGSSVTIGAMKVGGFIGVRTARNRIVTAAEQENVLARDRIGGLFKRAGTVEIYQDGATRDAGGEVVESGDLTVLRDANGSVWEVELVPSTGASSIEQNRASNGIYRLIFRERRPSDPEGGSMREEVLLAIAQHAEGNPVFAFDQGLLRARWWVSWQMQGQEFVQLEQATYTAYGVPLRMR